MKDKYLRLFQTYIQHNFVVLAQPDKNHASRTDILSMWICLTQTRLIKHKLPKTVHHSF